MGKEFHEVANIFPLMAGDEYDALKQSIAENGQREAIWLHPDGRIIDGRNRYRACTELGIAPRFRTWDGEGSLVQFALDYNLRHRHLTHEQKGLIALDILPMLEAEARERRKETEGRPSKLSQKVDSDSDGNSGKAAEQAAKAVGTNRTYVADMKAIQRDAPDLIEMLRAEQMTLAQAKKEVKRRKQEAKRAEEAAARASRSPEPEAPFVNLFVTEAHHLSMIDTGTVDVIITSPPYNLGDDTWPMGGNGRAPRDGIEYSRHGDNLEQCEYEDWQIQVFQELYRVAKAGASFFYNHKPRTVDGRIIHPVQWLCRPENPWIVRQEIIWDRKSTHNHSAGLFWPHDERIYWLTKGRPELNGQSVGMSTIWQEFGPIANTWHPAPFTLELPRMLLKAIHVSPGAVVLDPFAGSCTTLRAALEVGCIPIGVDIERQYLVTAAEEYGWRHAL